MLVTELIENEDGSAELKVELNTEEVNLLIEFAINEALKNYIYNNSERD
jgi:hypothetical protein